MSKDIRATQILPTVKWMNGPRIEIGERVLFPVRRTDIVSRVMRWLQIDDRIEMALFECVHSGKPGEALFVGNKYGEPIALDTR